MNECSFVLLSLTFKMEAKLPEGSKKNKVSFTEEDIERVISLWSTKEVLYRCSHPDYFKKDSRAAALADIVSKADIPGLTTEELWKKMSGLRTYYGKEIGKEKASKPTGTGAKDVYVSKWPFFSSLHFLRDNITPRKTYSTMDVNVDDQEEKKESTQDDFSPDNSCVFNTSNPPSFKSKKKIQMTNENELLATCIQELKKPKPETTNDTDTIFGQYITTQMKKIPDGYPKEMLKLDIQQAIVKVMMPMPARQFSTINFSDLE